MHESIWTSVSCIHKKIKDWFIPVLNDVCLLSEICCHQSAFCALQAIHCIQHAISLRSTLQTDRDVILPLDSQGQNNIHPHTYLTIIGSILQMYNVSFLLVCYLPDLSFSRGRSCTCLLSVTATFQSFPESIACYLKNSFYYFQSIASQKEKNSL